MTRNVLITGSSTGIGLAVANYFESCDYKVFKTGRREIKGANYFMADLKKTDEVKSLYDAAINHLGSIDILINNAGEYIYREIEGMGIDEISDMVALNLIAPYFLTSLAIGQMKKDGWGRIINIGSISGSVGEGNASLYSATKAGLIGMTKALALELAPCGITINTINPGWVNTELTEHAFDKSEIDVIPQKRLIEPIEVAKMAQYLASDCAKGVTGQAINLCAGLSVGC